MQQQKAAFASFRKAVGRCLSGDKNNGNVRGLKMRTQTLRCLDPGLLAQALIADDKRRRATASKDIERLIA